MNPLFNRPSAETKEFEFSIATRLLNLDEFEVINITDDKKQRNRRVDVLPKISVGLCPHCGVACNKTHEKREREVIDLPLGGFQTKLRICFHQFFCEACSKFFTQNFKSIVPGAHATERFLERASEMIKHSDIQSASLFFQVPEKSLEHWYYEYVRREHPDSKVLKPIKSLGIDELSLKKSIGSFAQ